MKYVYMVLILTSMIFATNVSQAIEEAKQAEQQFLLGLKTNNKEEIKNAYKSAKNALNKDVTNLRIKQLYYVIGVANISIAKDKNIVDEIKAVFPNLYMANINVAPPSYLDGLLLDQNETKKKIKLYKNALVENPRFSDVYLGLAEKYIDLNRYDLAINILQRGLKNTNTNSILFHSYLVNAYMFQSYYLESKSDCAAKDNTLTKNIIREAKKVLKLNPNAYEMYMHLANGYERLGRRILALEAISRVKEKDNSEDNQIIYEEYLLTNGAKNKYFDYLKKGKTSNSLANLANAYFYNQEWDKAVNNYKKHIDESETKDNFYTYYSYANVMRLSGKNSESIKILENLPDEIEINEWKQLLIDVFIKKVDDQAVLHKSDNVCKKTEAYFWIGMKYMKADKTKARQYFQKVLDQKVYSYVEYAASKYYLDEGIK